MLIDDFIEIELNFDNAKYLMFTDFAYEFNNHYFDDDDYFTYEDYEEESEVEEEDWFDIYDEDGEEDESEWCLEFIHNHPEIKTISIPVDYLDANSLEQVKIRCDSCEKSYFEAYSIHLQHSYEYGGDFCPDCCEI